jgi:membrane-associated protease RseP (regulator of RpoE activity)
MDMALKEIIKPGREKLFTDIILSIAWLALVFLHPFFGYDKILSSYDLPMKAATIAVNFLVALVFYYPMSCSLAYLYGLLAKKKKISGRRDLATAVFFILFLNPVFVSCAAIALNHLNDSMNTPCGAEITGLTGESAANNAGMRAGEVIVSADGYPVDTIDSFKHVLGGKRPGDYVTVKTDKKEYRVTVQENQDRSTRIIGIILKQRYCLR